MKTVVIMILNSMSNLLKMKVEVYGQTIKKFLKKTILSFGLQQNQSTENIKKEWKKLLEEYEKQTAKEKSGNMRGVLHLSKMPCITNQLKPFIKFHKEDVPHQKLPIPCTKPIFSLGR